MGKKNSKINSTHFVINVINIRKFEYGEKRGITRASK